MRNFLWGGTPLKKTTNLVNWENVLKSVGSRGLGLKYLHRNNPNDFKMKLMAYNIWQGISKGKEILTQGLQNLVGKGRNTSFWMDNWLEEKPLKDHLFREIDLVELYKHVSAYWTPGRG